VIAAARRRRDKDERRQAETRRTRRTHDGHEEVPLPHSNPFVFFVSFVFQDLDLR
jgi:hypothetical protein